MSNNLDRFIRDNRAAFDTEQPSGKLWDEIEKKIEPGSGNAPVYSIKKRGWMMAAAVALILFAASAYFIFRGNAPEKTPLAKKETTVLPGNQTYSGDDEIAAIDPAYAKQVAQFSELIDQKQNEIRSIENEQPSLYEKFSVDIQRLDTTYALLKKQLPVNPNKEELLEAMIYNLQLQISLLNQQLDVIQKIKQSKSKSL